MTYPIPEPFVWDESFRTFYTQVDCEHQVLFESIFDVTNEPNNDMCVGNMCSVMAIHFFNEERLMSASDYNGLQAHKLKHDHFLNYINDFKTPVSIGDVMYAKDWLVQHIKNTDFLYRGYLRA